jgi:methylase of polypeptide subunit release factors
MTVLSGIFSDTPINRNAIPQAILDIEDKQRVNPLPWKGQFSPQFIEALLGSFSKKGGIVFDPFLGSGTVLLEAGRIGLSACGTEINPAAIALAKTYSFINVPKDLRLKYIQTFLQAVNNCIQANTPLFQNSKSVSMPDTHELEEKLLDMVNDAEDELALILRESFIVLLDFYKASTIGGRATGVAKTIAHFINQLPYSEEGIQIFHSDARKVPLKESCVDLIITSPPYINVFNYHQQYRTSTEALNWKLLEVAKSEFGANRKHRSNRFLTVVQYCLDMALTFQELLRICNLGSHIIFVVGRESNVRKTRFFNGELVTEVAHRSCGLTIELRQERKFVNRFGQTIWEDILHFVKDRETLQPLSLEGARKVAVDSLEFIYKIASEDVKADIKDAIEKAGSIKPSPIYDKMRSRKLPPQSNSEVVKHV